MTTKHISPRQFVENYIEAWEDGMAGLAPAPDAPTNSGEGEVESDGPDVIWLQPSCCVEPIDGRQWSEDQWAWEDCDGHPQQGPTKYVRAALQPNPSQQGGAEAQIAWAPGEPPKDQGIVYGHSWQPFRWHPYSPKSEQWKSGLRGRWQAMNEYGGWENSKAPNEWAPESEIQRRAALNTQEARG